MAGKKLKAKDKTVQKYSREGLKETNLRTGKSRYVGASNRDSSGDDLVRKNLQEPSETSGASVLKDGRQRGDYEKEGRPERKDGSDKKEKGKIRSRLPESEDSNESINQEPEEADVHSVEKSENSGQMKTRNKRMAGHAIKESPDGWREDLDGELSADSKQEEGTGKKNRKYQNAVKKAQTAGEREFTPDAGAYQLSYRDQTYPSRMDSAVGDRGKAEDANSRMKQRPRRRQRSRSRVKQKKDVSDRSSRTSALREKTDDSQTGLREYPSSKRQNRQAVTKRQDQREGILDADEDALNESESEADWGVDSDDGSPPGQDATTLKRNYAGRYALLRQDGSSSASARGHPETDHPKTVQSEKIQSDGHGALIEDSPRSASKLRDTVLDDTIDLSDYREGIHEKSRREQLNREQRKRAALSDKGDAFETDGSESTDKARKKMYRGRLEQEETADTDTAAFQSRYEQGASTGGDSFTYRSRFKQETPTDEGTGSGQKKAQGLKNKKRSRLSFDDEENGMVSGYGMSPGKRVAVLAASTVSSGIHQKIQEDGGDNAAIESAFRSESAAEGLLAWGDRHRLHKKQAGMSYRNQKEREKQAHSEKRREEENTPYHRLKYKPDEDAFSDFTEDASGSAEFFAYDAPTGNMANDGTESSGTANVGTTEKRRAQGTRKTSEMSRRGAREKSVRYRGNSSGAVSETEEKRHKTQKFWQRRRYQKMAVAQQQEEKSVTSTVKMAQTVSQKARNAVKEIVSRNKTIFAGAAVFMLLFLVIAASLTSCAAIFTGGTNSMISSTYPSTDEDIYEMENAYLAMEAALQEQINSMESSNSGYDEYNYQIDEIGHNPYLLVSYFTAKYGEFTYDQIADELKEIFQLQYGMTTQSVQETVTSTKTVQVGESLGSVVTSGYCSCSICCGQWAGSPTASGVYPSGNHTLAVDASNPIVPIGTKVVMNGVEYTVEDTGNLNAYGVDFDVYYDSHSDALAHGHQTWEAYLADSNGSQSVTVTTTEVVGRLNVSVSSQDLDTILRNRMTSDEIVRYDLYNSTYGNRKDLFDVTTLTTGSSLTYNYSTEALSDTKFANMITEAEKYLGMAYVWGGYSPTTGFDCSGFVSWVINNCGNGWSYGRLTTNGLLAICDVIPASEAQPGDLIFFQGTYNTTGASHVGIYVGNGMMIHCGNPISYKSITSSYYVEHFLCFGRLP